MKFTRRSMFVGAGSIIVANKIHPAWADSPPTGRVAVEGGSVVWRRFGGGPKTPLLLIHGGPGVPSDYLDTLSALGDERAVYTWDQLGCGRSDHPNDSRLWTRARFVDEMAHVREALRLEQVHLFGHSWGGTLTVDYLLERGQVGVKSVVLASPLLSTDRYLADSKKLVKTLSKDSQAAIAMAIRTNDYSTSAFNKANDEYEARFLSRHPSPTTAVLLKRSLGGLAMPVYKTMWGPAEFICTGSLRTCEQVADLRKIGKPVLYVSGEYDEIPASTSHFYASRTPDAAVRVIAGSAHLTTIDNPFDTNREVRRFIEASD